MRQTQAKRLSFSQARWLRLLLGNTDPTCGLLTRSEHGGARGTRQSLQKLGFIDEANRLTDAGRDVARRCKAAFDANRPCPIAAPSKHPARNWQSA